ncbi:MAG: pectinesterase family protein [Paludibacter sp.]|nr:pectinesterase family protein [Paludibacter sp.]
MKLVLIILTLFVRSFTVNAGIPTDAIVVDRNGTGHYRNIQQAIDSVRAYNPTGTVTIYIKNGFYKEKLEIPTHICKLHIIGEDQYKTILNYDDHALIDNMRTFKTYTLKISGNDILIENLTVENSAAPMAQAVALHVEGDRVVFRNCRFLGNQDTVYAGRENSRQYFENCYIEGTTDFIFGPATAWFEQCEIVCKKNSYITAASTPEQIPYGFIFNSCTIKLAEGIDAVYLGRPWRPYAMTVFMNCHLPEGIVPPGWDNWRNPENEKTARYFEFNNTGLGASSAKRVAWSNSLSEMEVKTLTPNHVLKGYDKWKPVN